MKKPNLNNVWESYLKIPIEKDVINLIRENISPLVSRLKEDEIIGWYCFLVHPSRDKDDNNRSGPHSLDTFSHF